MRFGAALGLSAQSSVADVNAKIQVAQNISFSMAPISWNSAGKASQRLYLFTLTPSGITVADGAAFNQIRLQAINNFNAKRGAPASPTLSPPPAAPANSNTAPTTVPAPITAPPTNPPAAQ